MVGTWSKLPSIGIVGGPKEQRPSAKLLAPKPDLFTWWIILRPRPEPRNLIYNEQPKDRQPEVEGSAMASNIVNSHVGSTFCAQSLRENKRNNSNLKLRPMLAHG